MGRDNRHAGGPAMALREFNTCKSCVVQTALFAVKAAHENFDCFVRHVHGARRREVDTLREAVDLTAAGAVKPAHKEGCFAG